ncbi:MAG: hypothetical protein C0617_12790 [Desulfuromonas sp.]|uniref:murein hydrolase activator EnvC family protein n=1 Tax=Desulfuromonas sp. TaxID=892 RepID=UPI000CCABB02|nr:peptidoglycan DD-metalloendopeptidase family protein [Desulfuromonas sp.]PLX83107.1 MAG: hypothetical protein C0617_12790 [Desulfuromonas sp.]
MGEAERELARIGDRIARLKKRLAALEGEIADVGRDLAKGREKIRGLEGQVRKRLIALYKTGGTGMLSVLFSAETPARMAEDREFLCRIVRQDRVLLAEFRLRLDELEAARVRLDGLKRQQGAALDDLDRDRQRLAQVRKKREWLLARVRSDRAELSRQLEAMQERAARVGALIKKLESDKSRQYTDLTGEFASQKGRLPWPAKGDLRTGFGAWRHPELGTLHDSQGIEISAAGGQPIEAVWDGQVIFANWFKGYGQLIILDHGSGYYSLYAQASRLNRKVGDRVKRGAALGFTGEDGGDGVYFEIRHRGVPLDPTAWLAPH